jgi:hypothetical protein
VTTMQMKWNNRKIFNISKHDHSNKEFLHCFSVDRNEPPPYKCRLNCQSRNWSWNHHENYQNHENSRII